MRPAITPDCCYCYRPHEQHACGGPPQFKTSLIRRIPRRCGYSSCGNQCCQLIGQARQGRCSHVFMMNAPLNSGTRTTWLQANSRIGFMAVARIAARTQAFFGTWWHCFPLAPGGQTLNLRSLMAPYGKYHRSYRSNCLSRDDCRLSGKSS